MPMRRNKYGNVPVEADGYSFDSKVEERYYRQLKLLEAAGEIFDIQVHPTFLLQEEFTDGRGKKIRPVMVEMDFGFRETARPLVPIVVDIKGAKTDLFLLKEKLFRYRYRHIEMRVIPAREV
jgi:hypothetical protein